MSVFSGNLLTLAHGSTNAWSTANFLPLQKSDTLLPSGALSLHEAALVMSIYYIGAIVGNLTIPHVVQKYGCKSVLLVGAFPQIVSKFSTEITEFISNFILSHFFVDHLSAHYFRSKSILLVCNEYSGWFHGCFFGNLYASVCLRNIGR